MNYRVYFCIWINGSGISCETYYDELESYVNADDYLKGLDCFDDLCNEYNQNTNEDLYVIIKNVDGEILSECYISDIICEGC